MNVQRDEVMYKFLSFTIILNQNSSKATTPWNIASSLTYFENVGKIAYNCPWSSKVPSGKICSNDNYAAHNCLHS